MRAGEGVSFVVLMFVWYFENGEGLDIGVCCNSSPI